MHSTNQMLLQQQHEGVAPPSWGSGNSKHQKAKFIAMVAWSLIKDPADPELDRCDLTHQENLIGEVECLLMGSTPGSKFGEKAAELIRDIPEEQRK